MKFPMIPLYDHRYIIEVMRLYPITCPCLFIICRKSSVKWPQINIVLDEVEKWREVQVHWVDAGHDVHMTHPELVCSIIANILLKTEAKL